MGAAHREEQFRVPAQLRVRRTLGFPQESCEQWFLVADRSQPRLVLGGHVRVLLHHYVLVEGIPRGRQSQQDVELVDRGEITGVRATVFGVAHAISFEIRAHVEEEPLHVQRIGERPVEPKHIFQRRSRRLQQIRRKRARHPDRHNAANGLGGALVSEDGQPVVGQEDSLVLERSEGLELSATGGVVHRLVRENEPRRHAQRGPEQRCQRPGGRQLLGTRPNRFVPPAGGEVVAHHPEKLILLPLYHGERALVEDAADQVVTFGDDGVLELVQLGTAVEDLAPLGEVRLFQRGVVLDELVPDPPVEPGHGSRHRAEDIRGATAGRARRACGPAPACGLGRRTRRPAGGRTAARRRPVPRRARARCRSRG